MSAHHSNIRTIAADKHTRAGRLSKAKQFLNVANDARDLADDKSVADAAVTLYVHAGIAAADAMCAKALGTVAHGENHQQAIQLLASVDKKCAKQLQILLSMKTRAGYGHDPVNTQDLTRAERAATALVHAASL